MIVWLRPGNWYFVTKSPVRFRQVSALKHVRFRQVYCISKWINAFKVDTALGDWSNKKDFGSVTVSQHRFPRHIQFTANISLNTRITILLLVSGLQTLWWTWSHWGDNKGNWKWQELKGWCVSYMIFERRRFRVRMKLFDCLLSWCY